MSYVTTADLSIYVGGTAFAYRGLSSGDDFGKFPGPGNRRP